MCMIFWLINYIVHQFSHIVFDINYISLNDAKSMLTFATKINYYINYYIYALITK